MYQGKDGDTRKKNGSFKIVMKIVSSCLYQLEKLHETKKMSYNESWCDKRIFSVISNKEFCSSNLTSLGCINPSLRSCHICSRNFALKILSYSHIFSSNPTKNFLDPFTEFYSYIRALHRLPFHTFIPSTLTQRTFFVEPALGDMSDVIQRTHGRTCAGTYVCWIVNVCLETDGSCPSPKKTY